MQHRIRAALRGTWSCIADSAEQWNLDNVPRLAASLAFYTMLSLAPLGVITVGVAARAFGRQAVAGELAYQLQTYVGSQGAAAVEAIIRAAYNTGTGFAATTFGILVLLFGASSVVVELQDALNTIWHVPTIQGTKLRGILGMIRQRFYAFALVLGAGAVLILSLLISSGIAAVGKVLGSGALPETILQTATFATSYVLTTLLFGAIYKFVPDVRLRWSDVAIGSAVTALIFSIGRQAIALYLGKTAVGSTYGAAGSLAVFLIWVYYSAQLFFLGAEFTKVYASRYGSRSAAGLPAGAPAG